MSIILCFLNKKDFKDQYIATMQKNGSTIQIAKTTLLGVIRWLDDNYDYSYEVSFASILEFDRYVDYLLKM